MQSQHNQGRNAIIALLVAAAVAMLYLKKNSRVSPAQKSAATAITTASTLSTQTRADRVSADTAVAPNAGASPIAAASPMMDDLALRSEEAKKRFLSAARISVTLPEDLSYTSVDLEDNMASVYGYNPKTRVGLTVLAAPMNPTQEQVLGFVAQNGNEFPNLRGHRIGQFGAPQALQPPAGSGLSGATLWNSTTDDGRQVYVVFLQRSDAKGSYLFVASGPGSSLSENEDRFGATLSGFKALPAE